MSDNDLRQLYQDMILEHARKPRNFGEHEDANRHAHGHNPLCGDDITVHAEVDDKGIIKTVKFEGQGCAISTAAASIMTGLVKGKTLAEANELFTNFQHAVKDEGMEQKLPTKLKVFVGVKDYPMRVKCATLAWHTLHAALENKQEQVTTE